MRAGRYVRGEPAVRYRGLFINDEAPALSGWTREKFGGFNHTFYAHVFELLLRLRANFLWPAMWGNAFNDDDPLNPALADEYGIVMGTSHHEPMMRAHDEWRRYGSGPWNYATNADVLRAVLDRGRSPHGRATRTSSRWPCAATATSRCRGRPTSRCSSASSPTSARIIAERAEPRRHDGAAGVGALQGGAGVLREGHAGARRRDAAVVGRQLGEHPPAADGGGTDTVRRVRACTTTSTTWADRDPTSG